MNVLKRIALIAAPLAVLGGVAVGATAANAAPAPFVTQNVTTHFTWTAGHPELSVTGHGVVPAVHARVTFDVSALVRDAAPTATDAQVAAFVVNDEAALAGTGVPVTAFGHAGGDVTVTLPVISTGHVAGSLPFFEVGATSASTTGLSFSPTIGGTAVAGGSGAVTFNRSVFVAPYVYNGHTITVDTNRAVVGWNFGPGVSCALVQIVGFGFGTAGSPHVGYTCFNASVDPLDHGAKTNKGYLTGLHPHQTYALKITPATHVTDRADARPLPGARSGYVDVFTLAS